MTNSLLTLIQRFEGCQLKPYTDTVGKLTIGYGRNLQDKGISQEEADMMLQNDFADVTGSVTQALSWIGDLTLARQNVLFCMAFQMGLNGLLGFKNMLNACQQGKYDIASAAMLQSKWADQTPNRAKVLANMMISG